MGGPFLTLTEQRAITAALEGVDAVIEHNRKETNMLKCLKASVSNALLTRRIRMVPGKGDSV